MGFFKALTAESFVKHQVKWLRVGVAAGKDLHPSWTPKMLMKDAISAGVRSGPEEFEAYYEILELKWEQMSDWWAEEKERWIFVAIHLCFQFMYKAKRKPFDEEAYDIFRAVQKELNLDETQISRNMDMIRSFYSNIGFTLLHHIWADDDNIQA